VPPSWNSHVVLSYNTLSMISYATSHRSIEVVPGLRYYIWQGVGNNCNTCLFVNVLSGNHPHVIIDPGAWVDDAGENCVELLEAAMEKDGFRLDDVGLVLNTHYHTDHCAAADAILERNGAPYAMSREDYECGRSVPAEVYEGFGVRKPAYAPSIFLEEGPLALGQNGNGPARLRLQVIQTPGHSPGGLCFYWPQEKVLVAGDVVFAGNIGRTDFPGGSLTAIKESIDRLSGLDAEHLLPGHETEGGSLVSGKHNVARNFDVVKGLL